jgi:hypothetical protein
MLSLYMYIMTRKGKFCNSGKRYQETLFRRRLPRPKPHRAQGYYPVPYVVQGSQWTKKPTIIFGRIIIFTVFLSILIQNH